MSLIRTPEEIANIQGALTNGRFSGFYCLVASFLTRPEILRRLLPPGLEPTDQPLVQVSVMRWLRSSCIGGFHVASVLVRGRHGSTDGDYPVWMAVDTDAALIYGRDLVGEPKKLAEIELVREGNTVRGSARRAGSRALDVTAHLGAPTEMPSIGFNVWNYKYLLAPRADGFLYPPHLIRLIWQMKPNFAALGTGELTLGSSHHDPLEEIEIGQLLGTAYVEVEEEFTSHYEMLGPVQSEAFLPHAISRMDDWSALNNMDSDSPTTGPRRSA